MDPKPLSIDVVLVFWVCPGGSGGVPPGGSGAPGWQIPKTRGLLGRSEGRPCQFFSKTGQNIHFWHFGGYPPGGSGAPGWQNPGTRGLLCRSEGRPCQFSPKTVTKTHIFGFGVPSGGSGAPGWQNPGTRGLLRRSDGGDPANVPEKWPKQTFLAVLGVWGVFPGGLGPQPGRFQGPEAFWACPRPTCPVSCPETRKVVLCRLSSNPYRVREAKCLLGALTSRRAAGTGREDPQPDNNPFQLRFCCDTHILCRVRREAESEKAPPGGGLGG